MDYLCYISTSKSQGSLWNIVQKTKVTEVVGKTKQNNKNNKKTKNKKKIPLFSGYNRWLHNIWNQIRKRGVGHHISPFYIRSCWKLILVGLRESVFSKVLQHLINQSCSSRRKQSGDICVAQIRFDFFFNDRTLDV